MIYFFSGSTKVFSATQPSTSWVFATAESRFNDQSNSTPLYSFQNPTYSAMTWKTEIRLRANDGDRVDVHEGDDGDDDNDDDVDCWFQSFDVLFCQSGEQRYAH